MKAFTAFIIAGTAFAVSSPALAGRTEDQIQQQDRAVKQMRAQQRGLAGPVGERGRVGPGASADPRSYNFGHPGQRVRR